LSSVNINQAFLEYYRCPDHYAGFSPTAGSSNGSRRVRFRLGTDLVCYGILSSPDCGSAHDDDRDVLPSVRIEPSKCVLPFHLTDVVTNIRYERYLEESKQTQLEKVAHRLYYFVRPCLAVPVRRHLQRAWLSGWQRISFPKWPVDCTVDRILERAMSFCLKAFQADRIPFIWFWPDGKSSCAIMTHDVETAAGLDFCDELIRIDKSFQIRSSFQIIPEHRYHASTAFLKSIKDRGFDVNVHDLRHDGQLFVDQEQFQHSAEKINDYAVKFGSKGFRSGALYRKPEWYGSFNFSYDMSIPNIGHMESQPGGCCTVMPFFIGNILELPVTTTQDYSLFNILGQHSIDLWRQQIDIIRKQHGMTSFIVHPDYLNTSKAKATYEQLLQHLSTLRLQENMWIPSPDEVDAWWRQRSKMRLVREGSGWRIEGPGSGRAVIAYASLYEDRVVYAV
jgi:hypothetical protein